MSDNAQSSASLRFTQMLSNILSPPMVALGAVFVVACFSPIGTGLLFPWQSFLLGFIFIVIGPIVPLSLMVARGKMTFDVKNRRDRPLLYLAAIIVYVCGALIAWVLLNHAMAVLAIAYAAVTSAIAIMSLVWKVSAHAAGVAGPLTGLIWMYGLLVLPFMVLAGIVAWARWKLKLHTPLQLLIGILVAVIVTATVYWILWSLPIIL
jgi:membrane-associated phospholipid phosphatase